MEKRPTDETITKKGGSLDPPKKIVIVIYKNNLRSILNIWKDLP